MPARSFRFAVLLAAALGGLSSTWAQTSPQEEIERSLRARGAAERELTMRLEVPRGPPPPVPAGEVRRAATLPTPGSEILERRPPPELPPAPAVVSPGAPAVSAADLLQDSQRRRQSALQAENARLPIDDPARQQSTQIQGLTFEREMRAQDLGSAIMRSSERAVGR
ncbi:MAG TPA: hypothetical protein VD791_08430 [Burkholderiales bacterium]|nr:hypothetical protein [Burkholderiales bacterium]